MTLVSSLTNPASAIDTDKFYADRSGTDIYLTRAQIVAQVATDLATYQNSNDATVSNLGTTKLDKAGGTMTGALTLSGAPSSNLHAATKLYVDTADALLAPLASPTLTGTPAAPTAADGTSTTQIATTAFVLNQLDEYLFEQTNVTSATKTLTEDESGIINVNRAGTVGITLPTISGLSNPLRTYYIIKDTGFNANATTQLITISRGGSDVIENAATSTTISTAGESVHIYCDGTQWFIANVDTQASATATGVVELATTAEAQALSDTARVITPSTLGDVLDNTLFKTTELGASSKTLAEADAGLWYVTYTSTGSVAMTLPDPAGLSDPTKAVYEIVDAGNATTNNITISSGGAATIDGASSFTISKTRVGARFFTNGTNWFTSSNTQTASSAISGTANYMTKFNSTGDGVVDSIVIEDGDQLAFNASIDSNAFTKMANSSFKYSLSVAQSKSSGSAISAIYAVASGASTSNIGVLAGATGATANTAFYTGDNCGGNYYYGYQAVLQGGASTSTYGVNVDSSCTTGTVYGMYANLTGAATSNIGLYLSASGASSNTSLKIDYGNIDLSYAGLDIKLNTTTGTKIGTSTSQKLGFYNATPVTQPTAITQTYSTASATHAARTAPSAGTGAGADGTTFSGAQCDALVADQQNTAQVLNSLIDKLQTLGLIA